MLVDLSPTIWSLVDNHVNKFCAHISKWARNWNCWRIWQLFLFAMLLNCCQHLQHFVTRSVLRIKFFKELTFAPKSKPLIDQGFCFQFSEVGWSSTRGMTQIWQLEVSQQSRSRMFFLGSHFVLATSRNWLSKGAFTPNVKWKSRWHLTWHPMLYGWLFNIKWIST